MQTRINNYRRFMNLADSDSTVYNFLMVAERNIAYVPESLMELLEVPSTEFEDATEVIRSFTYREDLSAIHEFFENVLKNEEAVLQKRCRITSRTGVVFWAQISAYTEYYETENEHLIFGTIELMGVRRIADDTTGAFTVEKLKVDFLRYITEERNPHGAILLIGIDNLRAINSNYGRFAGDEAMRTLVKSASSVCGENAVYRNAGVDNITVLAKGCESSVEAREIYRLISMNIENYLKIQKSEYSFTVSAGITMFPELDLDYEVLHDCCEFALREAKDKGKNCAVAFDSTGFNTYIKKNELKRKLKNAVNNGFAAFDMYFQPLVDMKTLNLTGCEALIRFTDGDKLVSPAEFVPLLEETGLMVPVGRFIFRKCMERCRVWSELIPGFTMHINVSHIQFKKSNLVNDVRELLLETGVKPSNLVFELTESGFAMDDASFAAMLNELKKEGIRFALDDFGTGYSNFVYLKDTPVDIVKLDRTFVQGALEDTTEFELLKRIIDIVHSIDMKVCLEGVETMSELAYFSDEKPDTIQGYVFGKPVDADSFDRIHISGYRVGLDVGERYREELVSAKEPKDADRPVVAKVKSLRAELRKSRSYLRIVLLQPAIMAILAIMIFHDGSNKNLCIMGIIGFLLSLVAALIIKVRARALESEENIKRHLYQETQLTAVRASFDYICGISANDKLIVAYRSPELDYISSMEGRFTEHREEMLRHINQEDRVNYLAATEFEHLEKARANGTDIRCEMRLESKTGGYRWYELCISKASGIFEFADQPDMFIYMIRDIESMKRKEELLARSNQVLESQLDKARKMLREEGLDDRLIV